MKFGESDISVDIGIGMRLLVWLKSDVSYKYIVNYKLYFTG